MVVRLLAPGLVISTASFLSSSICGRIQSVDKRVPLAPPSWVFGIIWTLLYITTGIAWHRSGSDADGLFIGTLVACCAWLPLNTCGPKLLAPLVLMLSCILAMITTANVSGSNHKLVVPLVLWTAFATYLNIYDIWIL